MSMTSTSKACRLSNKNEESTLYLFFSVLHTVQMFRKHKRYCRSCKRLQLFHKKSNSFDHIISSGFLTLFLSNIISLETPLLNLWCKMGTELALYLWLILVNSLTLHNCNPWLVLRLLAIVVCHTRHSSSLHMHGKSLCQGTLLIDLKACHAAMLSSYVLISSIAIAMHT